jgi:hypothetical protein
MHLFTFIPVTSSNVAALAHDGKNCLRVRYLDGRMYDFTPVDSAKFQTLLSAPSVGKAINALGVKGRKVEP